MILYCVIMFAAAVLLGGLAIAICRGKTDLIHSYHQSRVTDKRAYGKAFGRGMFVTALAPFASGVIGLFGENMSMAAVVVLTVGLGLGIGLICAVQAKYNKGIF
ncbi:MAG: hypothetical protein IJE90_04760 [Clostridia bacterium]|nr:hypothetical protein [Clostridia bacterium]